MEHQIRVISEKLKELAAKDAAFQIFGAAKHRYRKKGRLEENEVSAFEKRHNIELPPDYREFILQISNGGPGPYYGLESLDNGLFEDLDYKSGLINPSLEFPLTEAWNLEFQDLSEGQYTQIRDDQYFDTKWTNGLLRVSNFGCGVSMNLVVNGKEFGNIWVDDRCNDGGIYPDRYFGNEGRITFLPWYELWLDKSLSQISNSGQKENNTNVPTKTSKPWWGMRFGRKK
jgi:hypothetical protein